jgi:hypothetical protein
MSEIELEDYSKRAQYPHVIGKREAAMVCVNGCVGPSGKPFGFPVRAEYVLMGPVCCPRCLSKPEYAELVRKYNITPTKCFAKFVGYFPEMPKDHKFAWLYDPRTIWRS